MFALRSSRLNSWLYAPEHASSLCRQMKFINCVYQSEIKFRGPAQTQRHRQSEHRTSQNTLWSILPYHDHDQSRAPRDYGSHCQRAPGPRFPWLPMHGHATHTNCGRITLTFRASGTTFRSRVCGLHTLPVSQRCTRGHRVDLTGVPGGLLR